MYSVSKFIATPHLLVSNLVRGVLLSSVVASRVDEHSDEMHLVMLRECLFKLAGQNSSPRDTGSSTHARATPPLYVIYIHSYTHGDCRAESYVAFTHSAQLCQSEE